MKDERWKMKGGKKKRQAKKKKGKKGRQAGQTTN